MRFTGVSNSMFGRGVSQFELHKAECQDVPRHKYRDGEATIIEARDVPDALEKMIDADLRGMGYSVSDVKVFHCANGGRTMTEAKQQIKQLKKKPENLKPMSEAERKAKIDEAVKAKSNIKEQIKAQLPAEVKEDKLPNEILREAKDIEKGIEREAGKKPPKPEKDPNELSVSDIAREAGVDPKAARAKLRRLKGKADGHHWPKVKRGSEKHKELLALFKGEGTVEG